MNKSRVKWISKLVYLGDADLLVTVRKYYTTKTEKMDLKQVYKAAKRLWSKKVKETKNWGKKKGKMNGKND